MEHSMMSKEVGCDINLTLPANGLSEEQIMESLQK
jgi:sphinganine-1-phosphate aldolase